MDQRRPNPIKHAGRYTRPAVLAFSLIELVMVMAIISVLAAIAVPRYAGALSRYRADAAAQRLVADLGYARERARTTSTSVVVSFQDSEKRVQLVGVPSLDNPEVEWTTDLSARPYRTDTMADNFSGHKVTFDGYGTPDATGKIVIIVGGESRTVRLDTNSGKAVVE